MMMHHDPSDLPLKIKYVPILQLGAKSNLTVMALSNELDLKISLRKGFSLQCREALPEDRAVLGSIKAIFLKQYALLSKETAEFLCLGRFGQR